MSSGKTKYLISFFDKNLLVSMDAVQYALLQCGNALAEENIEPLLEHLTTSSFSDSRPLLELILSGESCGGELSTWIVNHFPSTVDRYASSMAFAIITKLSVFLLFAYPFDRETSASLQSYHHRVELAPKVLSALAAVTFSVKMEKAEEGEDDWGYIKPQKASQRQTKRTKRIAAKAATPFDPNPFESLGILVPKSPKEVEMVSEALLEEHKSIFKFYLDRLRDPDVAAAIQRGFIQQDIIELQEVEEKSAPLDVAVDRETPSAYPMVQPMKAALYFDSAEGFGEWRILISTKADRDLREARRKQAKFFKIIIKKIKELSNGHLSADNHKRLNGPDTDIPIYEAKMTRDTRLIYQVDCIPEYDVDVERQVIKIFGIYTHAQIGKHLWDSMARQLGGRGKQYRERCTFRNRPHYAGDNVIMPAYFPPSEKRADDTLIVPELPKEDLEEVHSLLVLEKFVTLSQALLNSMSIIADLDVAHVFNVTPQEKEIIEHPYSCYVLGRSGTGKTTTMLFKMLGIERAFKLKQNSISKPRQMFVTQSRVLATKVEEYFFKLLNSLSAAGKSTQELAQLAKDRKSRSGEDGLIDLDDDINWRADLPTKFSLLKEEHFPLFLTFDRLLTLLEADLSELSSQFTSRTGAVLPAVSEAVEHVTPVLSRGDGKLVTYDVFLESCWPHFSQALRKGLDPSLVFSELMGVIQGSEESLTHKNRFLDKHTYENLSHRAQYTFAHQRDIVYSIFQAYIKQKRMRGDFDAADRTHDILKVIDEIGPPGQAVDYLYVDEAQDNLLIDALLLRSLCRNPDGLFWAGDTAQTISVGSSFRFNDLKAFLFRLEQRRQASQDFVHRSQEPPHTFQLAINYRSHGGIVNCAHSVIELITQFWPYAIDVLAQEQGVVNGSKPVFFSGWEADTVRYEQFLFGASGSRIEFGAQQCILVRDDSAREELRQQVGDIGLIMTLYESKGLEFDDVLLYKFFEDSIVDLSQWRVVLNLLSDRGNLGIPAPVFEESRHAGVCSELKFLYVAITRARKNLWIVDCSDKSDPMRLFWSSRKQIQHCTPGMDIPLIAVSSSPEEWEKSGRSLFQNKRYLQALHCFERAGLSREVTVSRSYHLREKARSLPVVESRKSQQARIAAFLVAAEAFLECAITAINTKEKRVYYRNAGDCLERAEEDHRAARAYLEGQEFTTAARLFRKCAKFDEAVDVVKQYRQEIDDDVAQSIVDVARLFYFRGGELRKAGQLFDSDEEQLEYLEDYDLDVSRAAVLQELGRYKEAGDIHLAEGRTIEAIQLFLKDDEDPYTVRRGHACILEGLWRYLSFAVKAQDAGVEAVQLLELSSRVKLTSTNPTVNDELAMFHAISSSDTTQLRDLGVKFVSRNEMMQALLCFDHYFNKLPNILVMGAAEVYQVLDDFLVYCRFLVQAATTPDLCNSPLMQKLFCIHPSTEKVYMLPIGTFLHNKIIESRGVITEAKEDGVLINEWNLARRFRECLFAHLRMRVVAEDEMCRRTRVFTPCLNFAINEMCNRRECPRDHISYTSFTHSWYNLQVKIHLQQILILHTLHAISMDFGERLRSHRYWITRLYETLHPSIYYLGTVASLDVALIPGAHRALEVVKGWSRDLLYSRHRWDARLLTVVYQTTSLCFYVDRVNARQYIHSAPVFNVFGAFPDYCRHLGGDDSQSACVVHELARSLQGTDHVFISAGILFVKQIVDKRIPFDVLALCGLIDYLCGSIILVRFRFYLHNVTLPGSWFISLLPRLKRDTVGAETNHLHFLVRSIQQLLDRLQAGAAGHLLFETSELDKVLSVRPIFIARLCRSICLLGYNINHPELRTAILNSTRQLRTSPTHYLYKMYATANTWGGLCRTVQQSTTESPLDEMVQLYHETKKLGCPAAPTGVRRVFYKAIEDVPRLLSEVSAPPFLSSLRADAIAFVPRQVRMAEDERATEGPNSEDPPAGAEVHEDIEEQEVDHTDVMNSTTAIETIANTALPDTNELPSEEVIHATGIFQAAYRKVLNRRREAAKTVAAASITIFFEACLAEASRMDWPHRQYYRKLYLGPLPHVLVCLSGVLSYLGGAKDKAKKRYKVATHRELDDVGKKMTELSGLMKDTQRLQAALQPQSELHCKRDVEGLKVYVNEVEKLLGRLPHASTREVKDDMEIALKGIVLVRKPPKAKPKPDILLDDD